MPAKELLKKTRVTPAEVAAPAKQAKRTRRLARQEKRTQQRSKAKGPSVFRLRDGQRRAARFSYNDLVNAESAIGRTLFGPVPAGHQREFFTLKKNVWLWYEGWTDAAGVWHDMTIRYEVRPAGVYKLPLGGTYTKLEGAELNNFATAVRTYFDQVKAKLYS